MADQLKHFFDRDRVARIGQMLAGAWPAFPRRWFVAAASKGLDGLELVGRARHIAAAMRATLPAAYPEAIDVMLRSLGPLLPLAEDDDIERVGMGPFVYLPHVMFVGAHGLADEDFETSMRAQLELTQRFSAEFSIRAYLERHTERTLARLAEWASHPSAHVRRLVSEGTRPRLPWAPRLRAFQVDPRPVLALLERLKDDPVLYVRRSVANNLNDIGKDHPALLVDVCRAWMRGASEERQWLVRHALRSAVKRGDAGALAVLGFGGAADLSVTARFAPARVRIGEACTAEVSVENRTRREQRAIVDLAVHFVKARGVGRKVFKLRAVTLAPGESVVLRKSLSFARHTTRTPYPGRHKVEVVVNGEAREVGSIDVR